ncbi:MAG: hypothetical protein JXQ75_22905 [Phycisphaerae bacterium]|nr:hypothetical protein [Phycisphaerae bacterium]
MPRALRLPPAWLFLSIAMVYASGCGPSASRNTRETVSVTVGPSLKEADVRFILELREERVDVALPDVEAFLAGGESSRLSRAVRADLEDKKGRLCRTLPEAARHGPGEAIVLRPNKELPFGGDNVVVFAKGRQGFRVYFSLQEIDDIFAMKEIAEDLSTVRYTNPSFSPGVLDTLEAQLTKHSIETPNLAVSSDEMRRLKTRTASAILERTLRELGVSFDSEVPLLASDGLGKTRSPRLTAALRQRSRIEQVISSHEPAVVRALVYLVAADVIELDNL